MDATQAARSDMTETLTPCIVPERLAWFTPFSHLDHEQLILLSHRIGIQYAHAGEELSPWGDERPEELFLLSGSVAVQDKTLQILFLDAADDRSRFSLLHSRPSSNQIICETEVTYFLLDAEMIQLMQAENNPTAPPLAEVLANEHSHPLVQRFYRSLLNNRLTMPVLPEVTQKISRIILEDRLNFDRMASLVSTDATLSARLLKLANSSFYRGQQPISQLLDAIVRLGSDTTRHLVMAFALKPHQKEHSSRWIRKRLMRSWKESIQLAALCYVLAKQCTHIPPEEALLAGLLHNIGELPLLQFADQYPELANDPDYLDQVIQEARGQAGAMILHRWNLPAALVTAVQHVDTWFYDPNGSEANLTDILILARLHSMAMQQKTAQTPAINQVPSYEKVSPGDLTQLQHLAILEDAKEQIAEIRSLLSQP